MNWEKLLSLDLKAGEVSATDCDEGELAYWMHPAKDKFFKDWVVLSDFKDLAILVSCYATDQDVGMNFWKGKKGVYVFKKSQRANIRSWLAGVYREECNEYSETHGLKQRKFGIEIEFTGIPRDTAARTVAKVLNGTGDKKYIGGAYRTHIIKDECGREWKIVRDGSIIPEVTNTRRAAEYENYKCELVSPLLEYKDLRTVVGIIIALQGKGAKVNESCGMHVHVDVHDFTPDKLRKLVNIMASKENLMIKALNISEKRIARWCKRTSRCFCDKINSCGKDICDWDIKRAYYERGLPYRHYSPDRYRILNMHSYFEGKGVEFRLFNSTLNANEVRANIVFAVAITCMADCRKKLVKYTFSEDKVTSEKSEMSTFLYSLGLRGEEFTFLRTYLKKNLSNETRWVA